MRDIMSVMSNCIDCFIVSEAETKKIQLVKFTTSQDEVPLSWQVYIVHVSDAMAYVASLRKKGYNKILIQKTSRVEFEKNGLYLNLFRQIPVPWLKFLLGNEKHILQISQDLEIVALKKSIYPKVEDVFRIFNLISPKNIKIIMIAHDPYPQKGVADGIAFSTHPGNPVPPSLRKIFQELRQFEHVEVDDNPDLSRWVKQGCFLINSAWTVQENEIGVHIDLWKVFVRRLVHFIHEEAEDVLCVFFGNEPKRKFKLIVPEERSYFVAHPQTSEKGFFNSQIFTKLNDHLLLLGKKPINWQ